MLVLAACGPASEEPATTDATIDQTTTSIGEGTAPADTQEQDTTTSTNATASTGTTSDRPLAPDFTLELGDGGTYTLSDGAKPVYLVFWAEW